MRRPLLFGGGCVVFFTAALLFAATADRWFEDVTKNAGVAFPHTNRSFENKYAHIMEGYTALGAAAAVADYNGDGFDDVFVTDSKDGGKNRLYRNNGDFSFTDVAEQAGVADGNDANNASAYALWFDMNNNGRPDLFVVRFGQNLLYENLGNGRFRDITAKAGLTRYMNAISAIAFDYDRDGRLDLFVGSYFQPVNLFNPDTPRFFPESFETANNGGGLTVFRNNGDGTFTDATKKAGFELAGWTLDIGHADADNDGDEDLYLAADFGTDRFFINNGDGTFTDITETAIGIDSKKGMNVDWGDFDGDGLLDIYVTNITDDYMREGNFLWRNNGPDDKGLLSFNDVSRETGTFNTGWGWAGKFLDYDNDGLLDIYVVNGWVSASEESYVPDIFEMVTRPGIDFADARNWPPMGKKSLSGYQKKRMFHNEGNGGFRDHAARHGIDSTRDGRGIAVADFDNDGRLDMFVTNANAEPYLYRNTIPLGTSRNWVQFHLEGTKSNRQAVGAQIRVRAGGRQQLSFVNGGNGFASQSMQRVHFGLGTAAQLESVEVRWPSGARQTFPNLPVNRIHKIVEGGNPLAFDAKAQK
ncbi:MAG: CRTAC1 family protein [Bryobacterales bacterium]|nr:CRTAC1 family protein [Bryobacterales bacterium]